MKIVFPKDDGSIAWTNHIKGKMVQYQLSAARIRRVLHSPKRREEGIAPGTVAAMQELGGKKKTELWVMYQIAAKGKEQGARSAPSKIRMISAWRYPGITKPGRPIPIPDDVWEELARAAAIDSRFSSA